MSSKPCTKCVHYKSMFGIPMCQRPIGDAYFDPVNGWTTDTLEDSCINERANSKGCGPHGMYFKRAPRTTFLERVIIAVILLSFLFIIGNI